MKGRHLCLVFFSFLTVLLHGQADSTYIGPFRQDFSIQTFVYQKFTSLGHEVEGVETRYEPNSPVGIGIGVSYKNFSLIGGRTFGFLRDKERGDTKLTDFQYHYYGKKFIADVFFQKYKGFYVEEGEEKKTFRLHPDISVTQYGLSGQYVFNHKKYSYRAAFYQREKQLKSTGSFHLGGDVFYNDFSGDDSLTIGRENRILHYQIGVSGGYAHTFIIRKNFFIALDVTVGANLGAERVKDILKSPEITPALLPRMAMGYNGDSWSIGINAVLNRIYVSRTQTASIMFDSGRMSLRFIKRFDAAPRFLREFRLLNK